MKILAIADVPPRHSLSEIIAKENIELVITLGDLEYTQIAALESVTHIPKIGIYGNHCTPGYMESLGIINLHMHTWTYNNLTFGGFEGSPRYKADPYAKMYTEDEASALLTQLPTVDVFIAHCPPRGINDEDDIAHQGFIGLRDYLDRQSPRHFFHGHTYPTTDKLVTTYRATTIHYINSDQVVSIN